MKKLFYLLTLFFSVLVYSQSYTQYKQQREYEQRYYNEAKAKYSATCNNALVEWSGLLTKYDGLLTKHGSNSIVNQKYSTMMKRMQELHSYLQSTTQFMNTAQQAKFQKLTQKNMSFWDRKEYYQ